MSPRTAPTYQLRVVLRGSDPPIWRQLHVPATLSLDKLHRVLQVAMGWEDDHLHQFVAGKKHYGVPMPGDLVRVHDESRTLVYRVLTRPGDRLVYEYDFGDRWLHDVVLEEILRPVSVPEHPVCIAGERAGPPEDCGGIWGYYDLLEAVGDPENPEHEELLEWVGESFDPDAFDREEVNRRLGAIG